MLVASCFFVRLGIKTEAFPLPYCNSDYETINSKKPYVSNLNKKTKKFLLGYFCATYCAIINMRIKIQEGEMTIKKASIIFTLAILVYSATHSSLA